MSKRCDVCEKSEVRYIKTLDLYLCRECLINTIESLIVEGGLVEEVKFMHGIGTAV